MRIKKPFALSKARLQFCLPNDRASPAARYPLTPARRLVHALLGRGLTENTCLLHLPRIVECHATIRHRTSVRAYTAVYQRRSKPASPLKR